MQFRPWVDHGYRLSARGSSPRHLFSSVRPTDTEDPDTRRRGRRDILVVTRRHTSANEYFYATLIPVHIYICLSVCMYVYVCLFVLFFSAEHDFNCRSTIIDRSVV